MNGGGGLPEAAPLAGVADAVRTTLGPFGANKLVVGTGGEVTSTSSGSLVLEKLDCEDPSERLLAAEAETFRAQYGDGATTFVLLAGELLDRAATLHERGLHPTVIERGYVDAAGVAAERISEVARPLSSVGPPASADRSATGPSSGRPSSDGSSPGAAAVAETALTATRNPSVRRQVGEYLSRVVEEMADEAGAFDSRNVRVVSRLGSGSQATDLVRGLVLDYDPVHEAMPRSATDAGVALVSSTVDLRRIGSRDERTSGVRVSLDVDSFEDRAAIRDWERDGFREALRTTSDLGCRLLATDDAVAERVQTDLADAGLLALQRVDDADLRLLARATGAAVVPDVEHITADALGRADVSVRRVAGRDMITVEGRGEPPVYTVFVRAPDPRSVDEFERSVESALAAVGFARRADAVVPGGGAVELAAANAVRDAARSVGGREQLAAEAFADALEVVPRVLAENGGLDVHDAISRLRTAHDDGEESVGIDSISGGIADAFGDDPIADPAALKRDVVASAADLAAKLVRIDERLPATDLGNGDGSVPGESGGGRSGADGGSRSGADGAERA